MNKKLLVAAAISGMVAAGTMTISTNAYAKGGECHGINSCKGKGACGGKNHGCAGKNECKGKGWKKMSKKDCEAKILEKAKENGMFFKKG